MNLLKLSLRNLLDKPLNLTLCLTLFALGTGLVSLLLLLNKQLTDNFEKNLAGIDLVIGAKGSPLQLILCSMYHVDAPTGNISLKEARPFLNPAHPLIGVAVPLSLGDSYRGHRIIGTNPDFFTLYNGAFSEGKIWEEPFHTVLGASVAEKLRLTIGSTFRSNHGLANDSTIVHEHGMFKVIGILKPSGTVMDQLILVNQATIWQTHEHHDDEKEASVESKKAHDHTEKHDHEAENHDEHEDDRQITSILCKYKTKNFQTLNMARQINQNTNFLAASPAWEMNRLYANIGAGEEMLRWLALVIVIVSGLSVFISLYNSLKDRRYELSLIRVMGATRSRVFWLIVVEGLLLALGGVLLGLLISHIGVGLIGRILEKGYRYNFTGWVFLKEEIWVFFGALGLGFLAAILPAWQAYRTDISKTLAK
jgi:putative ABC transport system permease protein